MYKQLVWRFSSSSSRKYVFMFGAPGVGKGTFAQRMARDLNLNQISTGDEIRKILKTPESSGFSEDLIKEIKDVVSRGGLVSDDIVLKILEEKVKQPESDNGVILDGFPRTISQLEKYEERGFRSDLVINIFLNQQILLEKLMARRTCVDCGNGYNLVDIHRDGYDFYPLLPKKEGICDRCSGKLIVRPDDTEEVISTRMVEYDQKTMPLLDVYKSRNICIEFEPKKGVQDYQKFLDFVTPHVDAIQP